MKNKKIIILAVTSFMLIGIVISGFLIAKNRDFLRQFQSFAVTVDNQSDAEITSVELGIIAGVDNGKIIKGVSRQVFTLSLAQGKDETFTPRLTKAGEAAVYMEYSNSRGETFRETVCGYTESLTGFSEVTINNDGPVVYQQCW